MSGAELPKRNRAWIELWRELLAPGPTPPPSAPADQSEQEATPATKMADMSTKEDRAWHDYSQRFRREVLPKLMDSAVFLSIGSEVGDFDVRQATELGAALLMGKPILLVVPPGRTLSPQLLRAADEVIDDWQPEQKESQDRLTAALERLGRDKESD
jgi:hypothetical protein